MLTLCARCTLSKTPRSATRNALSQEGQCITSTPDGSKRCKKFYQPHVEAGDEIDVGLNSAGFGDRATHMHKLVGNKSFVCSIRYATVEGLAIRGVVSRATHPHLFDDKKSRKHRAARSPLVKEESPAKKAKPEVIEIE